MSYSQAASRYHPNLYYKYGPWGGRSGAEWTDERCTDIKKIIILSGEDGIQAIQVVYLLSGGDNGNIEVPAPKHGGSGGDRKEFDMPQGEILIKVEGSFSENSGGIRVIKTLKFYTNNTTFGPYGSTLPGRLFSFRTGLGKIVGFHGRCNDTHLTAIGVYTMRRITR